MAIPRKPERTYIKLDKAPPYVKEMIGNMDITVPIFKNFPAIKEVILEASRNAVTMENQTEAAPMLLALGHLFTHFCLLRDQGKHDADYIEKLKQQ